MLKLDGVNPAHQPLRRRYLGDPLFDDVMAELDRRRAVAFVRRSCQDSESIRLDMPGFAAEFVFAPRARRST